MSVEEIWQEYRAAVKAFLHSKVSNPEDVEDLLQEIVIRVYQNLDNLKSQEKVKPWVFKIASNAIVDFYRKSGKISDAHPEDLWYLGQEEDTGHAFSPCVEPFINSLSSDTAKLLTAIDLKGCSQKEYAETIGVSYSTLKSRVQKGRKQLYELFHDCCDISIDHRGKIIEYDVKPGKFEHVRGILKRKPCCL